jgi:hypothetical protein
VWAAYLWSAKILFGCEVHDEHVCWLHEFFLDARGRDVDVVAMADGGSAASTGNLFTVFMLVIIVLLYPLSTASGVATTIGKMYPA